VTFPCLFLLGANVYFSTLLTVGVPRRPQLNGFSVSLRRSPLSIFLYSSLLLNSRSFLHIRADGHGHVFSLSKGDGVDARWPLFFFFLPSPPPPIVVSFFAVITRRKGDALFPFYVPATSCWIARLLFCSFFFFFFPFIFVECALPIYALVATRVMRRNVLFLSCFFFFFFCLSLR